MNFGLSNYGKLTPNRINILFDSISAGLGIVSAFFTGAAFISHSVSDVVVSIITGLLIPLCPVIKRLFSVDIEQGQKTVPVKDVVVIEEKPQ